MPIPLPLIVVAKELVIDSAIKAGRNVWSKTAWAKDKSKVDAVEARIRRLVADSTDSARNLSDESLEPSIEKLIQQFQRDLPALGLTSDEADELAKVQREQIQTTVLEPARERRQILKWVKELEEQTEKSRLALEKHGKEMERVAMLERQMINLKIAVAVSATLSMASFFIAVLLFVRH